MSSCRQAQKSLQTQASKKALPSSLTNAVLKLLKKPKETSSSIPSIIDTIDENRRKKYAELLDTIEYDSENIFTIVVGIAFLRLLIKRHSDALEPSNEDFEKFGDFYKQKNWSFLFIEFCKKIIATHPKSIKEIYWTFNTLRRCLGSNFDENTGKLVLENPIFTNLFFILTQKINDDSFALSIFEKISKNPERFEKLSDFYYYLKKIGYSNPLQFSNKIHIHALLEIYSQDSDEKKSHTTSASIQQKLIAYFPKWISKLKSQTRLGDLMLARSEETFHILMTQFLDSESWYNDLGAQEFESMKKLLDLCAGFFQKPSHQEHMNFATHYSNLQELTKIILQNPSLSGIMYEDFSKNHQKEAPKQLLAAAKKIVSQQQTLHILHAVSKSARTNETNKKRRDSSSLPEEKKEKKQDKIPTLGLHSLDQNSLFSIIEFSGGLPTKILEKKKRATVSKSDGQEVPPEEKQHANDTKPTTPANIEGDDSATNVQSDARQGGENQDGSGTALTPLSHLGFKLEPLTHTYTAPPSPVVKDDVVGDENLQNLQSTTNTTDQTQSDAALESKKEKQKPETGNSSLLVDVSQAPPKVNSNQSQSSPAQKVSPEEQQCTDDTKSTTPANTEAVSAITNLAPSASIPPNSAPAQSQRHAFFACVPPLSQETKSKLKKAGVGLSVAAGIISTLLLTETGLTLANPDKTATGLLSHLSQQNLIIILAIVGAALLAGIATAIVCHRHQEAPALQFS